MAVHMPHAMSLVTLVIIYLVFPANVVALWWSVCKEIQLSLRNVTLRISAICVLPFEVTQVHRN